SSPTSAPSPPPRRPSASPPTGPRSWSGCAGWSPGVARFCAAPWRGRRRASTTSRAGPVSAARWTGSATRSAGSTTWASGSGRRLGRATRLRLEQARQALEGQGARLEGLSPLKVFGRGYSLTRRVEDMAVVRSAGQLVPGDWIVTQLADGRVVSRVETVG